jgi:class 3 adenylate cyclase
MSVEADEGRPAARLTFLLTDVEGSTRRWEADPDRMAALLEAHDATIEAEVGKAGGELIKARGEGDSTFAVFPDPPAALNAALASQIRLTSELGLPVRMAIHTGETDPRWGEYYGPPVNRAARLRSLAAGGRVLLSASAAACVRSMLPAGCQLVDLGVFMLRDLERPERIFGVHHPALPEVVTPRFVLLPPDLVGRVEELSILRGMLGDAEVARPRIAVVIGEGGIGKTRLAEVVGREACASGGRLVWVTAPADLAAPPFSVWSDLLTRLLDDGQSVPDREVFYDRIIATVRGAAALGPMTVVLDDMHRADPSSLQLLRRMGSERDLGRLLLLVLSRPTRPEHPARRVLTELGRAQHATTINLPELSYEHCIQLVSGYAPELETATITEVVRHAGGNPLFLRAYAAGIRHTGVTAMPETVRTAIGERLAAIESRPARVLEVAAVAGRSIAVDITAAAAGVEEAVVLRALAAGETEGLVSRASMTFPSWRFSHDIVCDAVAAAVDPAERAAVHAQVGLAIERLRQSQLDVHAAEIASHFSQATAEFWPRAVSYGEVAAQTALRAGAFEQATGHCQRALGQLGGTGGDNRQRARLLIMLGSALTADDTDAAGNAILDAIGIARSLGDQELLIRAIEALPPDSGPLDARAVAELQAVVQQVGDEESALAARMHGHLAFHHFTARHWKELQQEADAAWRLSRGMTDPATRFFGSLGRLLTLWCDPDLETSRRVLDECTWSAEACIDPSIKIRGRYLRGRPLIESADRDGFAATAELVEEKVSGYVATYSQWVATTWRILEATVDGELDRAESLLRRTTELGQGWRQISLAAQFHQRSMLRYEQDRLAEEVEAIGGALGVLPGHPVVLGWQALALADAGDERTARGIIAALDDDGFESVPAPLCFALAPLMEVAVRLREATVAARLSQALEPRAGHLLVGFGIASTCYGAVDRYLGLAAALAGDSEGALAHHAAAARLHRRFRSRLWLLHSQIDTAAVLRGRAGGDDLSRARSLVQAVTEEAAGTPMRRVQHRAAALLTQLG